MAISRCSLSWWGGLVVAAACHHEPPALAPLPRPALAHYLAARLAAIDSDWKAMATELGSAASAAPDEAMIAVELARAQGRAGDVAAARATIDAARVRWPDHPEVWLAAGDLLAKTAPDDAARAYRKAIGLDADEERAYLGLVRVDPKHAEATLRALTEHVPVCNS